MNVRHDYWLKWWVIICLNSTSSCTTKTKEDAGCICQQWLSCRSSLCLLWCLICWSHMAGLTSTTRVSARIAQFPQHSPVGLHFHEESTSILLICISVMAVNFCHSSSFAGLLFCRLLQNSNSWDASLMPRVLCNCFSVFGLILLPMLHCHT